MSNITFSLDNLTAGAPLHMQFVGQCQAQPAFVTLTEDGEVFAEWSSVIGSGCSMREWHGLDRSYGVPAEVNGTKLREYLTGDALPLLERIHAGHSSEWDGSNYVGRLTEDATEASEALEEALRDMPTVGVWSMAEWLFGQGRLIDAWGDCSLDEAVTKAEDGIANVDDENVVTGDARETLLAEAESRFDEDGDDGLNEHHLAALVAAGRITQEQADARKATE